jgi:hypothetical protein
MSGKDEVFYITDKEILDYKIEKKIIKKILKGRDIKSYKISWGGCMQFIHMTNILK